MYRRFFRRAEPALQSGFGLPRLTQVKAGQLLRYFAAVFVAVPKVRLQTSSQNALYLANT